jgi:hypothetical protein
MANSRFPVVDPDGFVALVRCGASIYDDRFSGFPLPAPTVGEWDPAGRAMRGEAVVLSRVFPTEQSGGVEYTREWFGNW